MKTLDQRHADLESKISTVAGREVELTIRGEREFTLSTEGDHCDLLRKTAQQIGGKVDSVEFDEECDFTCCFFRG